MDVSLDRKLRLLLNSNGWSGGFIELESHSNIFKFYNAYDDTIAVNDHSHSC